MEQKYSSFLLLRYDDDGIEIVELGIVLLSVSRSYPEIPDN